MTFIAEHCTTIRTTIRRLLCLGGAALLAGCQTLAGGPDRLYTPQQEANQALMTLQGLEADYRLANPEGQRRLRNEIVGRRMYIIDVNYSEYELKLTKERQLVGFTAATVAQGLGTAGALATPAQTARLLSGLSAAVGATRGFYDSEVVLAKTIQIVQSQMRIERNKIATTIYARQNDPIDIYPLSMAMGDLEDYYLAGTFTTGLTSALGDAGSKVQETQAIKTDVKIEPEKALVMTGVRDKTRQTAKRQKPPRYASR